MKQIFTLFCGLIFLLLLASCEKEFLDKKPNQSLLVPTTLTDFQAILDAPLFGNTPGMNEISSGDFNTGDAGVMTLNPLEMNCYLWKSNMFAGMRMVYDWTYCYNQVFNANVVLDGLEKLDGSSTNKDFMLIKASALFYRAYAFYSLAGNFAQPYDANTAADDLGIPLRLIADVNVKSKRANVKETYDQILKDLNTAIDFLPETTLYKSRPTKCAVYALLSRIYLSMQKYDEAKRFADLALSINDKLIDYNDLDKTSLSSVFPSPLPNANDEVIFYKGLVVYRFPTRSALAGVDIELYRSYHDNDLRKIVFFRNRGNDVFTFKGSYTGSMDINLFGGLATDELYLIRAECLARKGDVTAALLDLNTLMVTRWKTGSFLPFKIRNEEECLSLILEERRKELIARGIRWSDLRRLNKDPKFAVTLKRVVNGVTYVLLPNDLRYVFPMPDDEVNDKGMKQNPY